MSDIEQVRPLAEITSPDPRHTGHGYLPATLYESVAKIQLNATAPHNVRQLFETAKNLSLYTWFVYRFHPIARVVAYSCMEAALRHRVAGIPKFTKPDKPDWHPGFKDMFKHAVKAGWIRNEGFENARIHARGRAKHKAVFAQIAKMNAEGIERMPTAEPTEDEIQAELGGLPYAQNLVDAWPFIRNWIAHGNTLVDSGSAGTLRVVAEAINQLYPARVQRP